MMTVFGMRRCTTASLLESTEKGTVSRAPLGPRHFLVQKKKKSASLGTFPITPPTPAPNDLRECHEYQYHAWRLLRSSSGPEERRKGRHVGSATPTETFSHLQMKCTCHSKENISEAVPAFAAAPSASLAIENYCRFDLLIPVISCSKTVRRWEIIFW